MSTAPSDVIRGIQEERNAELVYMDEVQRESKKLEVERELLQKHIYDNANPSPVFVLGIAILVLFGMYIVYVAYVKPCMTGEWLDVAGNKWHIKHNRATGEFTVKINDKPAGTGTTFDNYVKYGDLVGVWDYANIVTFIEGWHIQRVKE